MILGLDPSLSGTGYCLGFTESEIGVIKNKGNTTESIGLIFEKLEKLILENNIKYIIKEGYAYGFSNQGVTRVMEVGGIIRLLAYKYNCEVIEIPPTTIKKIFTGNGKAKKKDILLKANQLYGLDIKDDNIADAIAVYSIGSKYLEISKDQDDIKNFYKQLGEYFK